MSSSDAISALLVDRGELAGQSLASIISRVYAQEA
jgi:hypothetical protein